HCSGIGRLRLAGPALTNRRCPDGGARGICVIEAGGGFRRRRCTGACRPRDRNSGAPERVRSGAVCRFDRNASRTTRTPPEVGIERTPAGGGQLQPAAGPFVLPRAVRRSVHGTPRMSIKFFSKTADIQVSG